MNRNFYSFLDEVREEVRTDGIQQFESFRIKVRKSAGIQLGNTNSLDGTTLVDIISNLKACLRNLPEDQRADAYINVDYDYAREDGLAVHDFYVGVHAMMDDDELVRYVANMRCGDYTKQCSVNERISQEEKIRNSEIQQLKELAKKYPGVLNGAKK